MDTSSRATLDPAAVAVFAPSPIVTVTLEAQPTGATELHLHAGGQGVWIARMIERLGGQPILCAALGGESGTVLRALIEAEGVELSEVRVDGPNGSYVHDRREGERRVVAEASPTPLNRHELDALYGATFSAAVAAGTCVVTGTEPSVVPADTFRRLTADLRHNGVDVIVDTSRESLRAALAGRPSLVKNSHEELIRDGFSEGAEDAQLLRAIGRLQAAGAQDVVVSRAGEPVLASLGGHLLAVDCPPIEVVDAMGGGDTMTATLAIARAQGVADVEALRLAVSAATLNVARHGLATGRRGDIERVAATIAIREIPGERGGP